jgi:hypothetical protein
LKLKLFFYKILIFKPDAGLFDDGVVGAAPLGLSSEVGLRRAPQGRNPIWFQRFSLPLVYFLWVNVVKPFQGVAFSLGDGRGFHGVQAQFFFFFFITLKPRVE